MGLSIGDEKTAYFSVPKAYAPGQRLDWMTEMAYWGTRVDDRRALHGGMFSISVRAGKDHTFDYLISLIL